jgi:hypothetical protein
MSTDSDKDPPAGVFTVTITGDGLNVEKEIDSEQAMAIIALAMGASTPTVGGAAANNSAPKRRSSRGSRRSGAAASASGTKRTRRSGGPSVVKDLSLRPKGKKAFGDFVADKQPSSHQQKQLVAVYWLAKEAGISSGVTVDHINTCYQGAGWKRPSNLGNALAVTSMRKGWLDTSDGSDIKLTVPGEDFVLHELPPKKKK